MKKRKVTSRMFGIGLVLIMTLGMIGGLPGFAGRVEASPATEIRDWYDLDAIRNNLGGNYILMNDLDSTTAGYEELASSTANDGEGWRPIYDLDTHASFVGTFGGQGYAIRDLFINRPDRNWVGLFDSVGEGAIIDGIRVLNATVTGNAYVGSLAGGNRGIVIKCCSNSSVSGASNVGGLVGSNHGTVSQCYSTGSVTGSEDVGGIVGENSGGTITNSHSSSNVSGDFFSGGLVGLNWQGRVEDCYSIGGVVPCLYDGGLVGVDSWGIVRDSFRDKETSGQKSSEGGTGKTTAEMMDIATFTDTATAGLDEAWDIAAVAAGETNPAYTWNIVDGQTYPFLSWAAPKTGLADSPWPTLRQNVQRTGRSPFTGPEIPELKWSFTTGGAIYSSPAIGTDGTIYVGSNDNNLYAINPDGSEKWRFITSGVVKSSPTIGVDGTIYVGSGDGELYAINPDGSEKWRFTVGSPIESSPVISSDGTIYLGAYYANKLYAINSDGSEKWNFIGKQYVGCPAIGTDGTVYVGSSYMVFASVYDGWLHAIGPDGTEKWTFATIGCAHLTPSIGPDGTIYMPTYTPGFISWSFQLYAVNADGTERWRRNQEGTYGPAVGAAGMIYSGSSPLYAINPDGTLKWDFAAGEYLTTSPTIDANETMYVGSLEGHLIAIGADGIEKWRLSTGGRVDTGPAIGVDGTIYVGSSDGELYAVGEAGPLVDPSKSAMEASPAQSTPADGFSASTITVTLRDSNDNPVPGKSVKIVTVPEVAVEQPTLPTDENGQATSKIRSLRAGSINVTAIDVTDNIQLAEHTSVGFDRVWYAFDGHVHSTYSWWDGEATVLEQASEAHRRNNDPIIDNDIDAMIITDHGPMLDTYRSGVSDGPVVWDQMEKDCSLANYETDEDPLTLPGEELGGTRKLPLGNTGHYLAYNIESFVDSYVIDKFFRNEPQEHIDRVNNQGGFGFIAHPYEGDVWPGKPWENCYGFAGIELLNGAEKEASVDTLNAWDKLISNHLTNIRNGKVATEGQQGWVGIGNSDAHNTTALGQNKNYVYISGGLTPEKLYSSLKKGQVIASRGPMVTFTISPLDTNGEEIGNPNKIGEVLNATVGQNATLHIAWDTMGSGNLEGIYMSDMSGTTIPKPNWKRIEDAEGNVGYIEDEIELTSAGYLCLSANLTDGKGMAYTNPIFINATGPSAASDLSQEDSILVKALDVIEEYVGTTTSWAEAIFRIDWPGSTVGLTLVDPDGLVITPDSQPGNVYHEVGPTYEFYQVTQPLPGTWTVKIEGVDVPSGGETVNLEVWSRISTKPQIEILQPVRGAEVSGLVNISVNASDKEGISELACYVDGTLLGNGVNPPYEFSWDSTRVEDGAHLVTVWLTDVDGNTDGDSAQVYVVNYPELQTLSLQAGWNMVSVPVMPADNSASAVFAGAAGIFTWDATSRSYYVPEAIEPEKGYWVAVAENTTITISGIPAETWTTYVKAGWNMIGSVAANSSIAEPNDDPDGSVIPPAYWWDPVGTSYIFTTDIEPGKGYWLASVNDCALTL